MPGCLADVSWKVSYGPTDDRLRELYIPALSRSVTYARTAGFFSSGALAVAAAGVAHLVRNGGRMRLLVGAKLSEEDIRAIERGEEAFGQVLEQRLLEALEELERDPSDPARKRLEVLAWMVAQGTLQIRVVLPTGPDGRPLPADVAADYFHPKEGLFTDACGHMLAFSGSANETRHGWLDNYENLMVFTSWGNVRPWLLQIAARIDRLWQDREEGWRALPVPEAVRLRLIRYAPAEPPEKDPLEQPVRPRPRIPADQKERIVFQFLRDAPLLPGGEHVGAQTAVVRPWPHQVRIVREVVRRFPERFLLADEVGLGKTVEAGLILRSLLLAGRVRRCLILVPRSVLRQWQEELYEKFSLNIPSYEGQGFRDYFGEVPAPAGNPWNAYPVLLASSQLAKRRDRMMEVLAAEPWDLVIIDEAHHARRKEFRTEAYRPNRLLSLLEGDGTTRGLAERTRGLLLLTATPLQIHPVEVYDLIRQLQPPALWSASERLFLRFFEELRKARTGDPVDWKFVLRMARDALDGVSADELMGPGVRARVGPVDWDRIRELLEGRRPPEEAAALPPEARAVLIEACRRASPLARQMFRTTREQLRRYRERGILADPVPVRDPQPCWIALSHEEWELYRRVEDYVSDFYQRYEGERRGLGFIMTVYRRRLTSSFAALARSLERRRAYLLDLRGPAFGITDEDAEDDDLGQDVVEDLEAEVQEGRLPPGVRRLLEAELRELERLLDDVRRVGDDSKFQRLVEDLGALLAKRDRAAVFTHYTDTMDALRDRLVAVYGRRLACYSGRGGERWNGSQWVAVRKEEVKDAFRRGEVQVLLCTDAASEGLNLQTCGVLINYDMPWNPMRVEQRIGRFDRIGQVHPDVWIRHYFLTGPSGERTVEARVYEALGDRIDWFRTIVGELQPILSRVPEVIERAVTTRREDRAGLLERLIADLRRDIEAHQATELPLEEAGELSPAHGDELGPLTLAELEEVLRSGSVGRRFAPHREIAGAWVLDLGGRLWEVTFSPDVADAHPGRVRLLTPGEPLLEELLRVVERPVAAESGAGLIRASAGGNVRWYRPMGASVEEIRTFRELKQALAAGANEVSEQQKEHAREQILREVRLAREQMEERDVRRAQEERRRLEEQARLTLAGAAACRRVLDGLDEFAAAWAALVHSGYPFAGLARLVGQPDESDMAAVSESIVSPDTARHRFEAYRERAKELLHLLAAANKDQRHAPDSFTREPEAHVSVLPW